MFHPKHFEAQILVWDNLHFSLWLCCFALFSLLLLWATSSWSCVFAHWVFAVRAPGPCAADRTSWPALARAHLAAPTCLPGCQHQQLCLVAPLEELGDLSIASLPPWCSLHKCDVTFPLKLPAHGGFWWHRYKAQKRQFSDMVKDNDIPIESSSYQAHPLDSLTPE